MMRPYSLLDITFKIYRRIRNILVSAPFNFRHLPFRQAIHIPVLLHKVCLCGNKGKFRIDSDNIKYGMIHLGFWEVGIYPDDGMTIQNNGTIVFKGECNISNDCYLSVARNGILTLGKNFEMNASKIGCHNSIVFEDWCSVGFGSVIVDTDFHRLSYEGEEHCNLGEIYFGKGVWLAMQCTVLKNTFVPDYCVVAARSLLAKHYDVPSHSLLCGVPAVLKRTGVYRNRENGNDKI